MIKIVTGPINTGKTTWLFEDYKSKENADGFACRKIRANDEHIGYELVQLSTGKTCHFISKVDRIPQNWNEVFRLGKHYSFNKEGLEFAKNIVESSLEKSVKCFYLDELGHLELKGSGFADILKRLLKEKIDLVLVIREGLLEQMCKAFEINDYEIIRPNLL